jgi:hypothetical protein
LLVEDHNPRVKAADGTLEASWVEMVTFNCANETYFVAQFTPYAANGTALNSGDVSAWVGQWVQTSPHTIGGDEVRLMCQAVQ